MTGGLPPDLPVVDHHIHLSARGEGVEAVRRFAAAGGTHLFLATQDYGSVPLRPDGYVAQFDETVRLARAALESTGVTVYSVLAPYPIDLIHQAEKLGLSAAIDLQRAALDIAGRRVAEREAVALGEVGSIHFPVEETIRAGAAQVLQHACGVARDRGCPIVVHSADLDADGFSALAGVATAMGLQPGRVVKHYARSIVPAAQRAGVVPSYLARRETVTAALSEELPWFLETDFLDDPSRPGAVLDLTTVPKRARALADRDPAALERLRGPFVESVRRVYGFAPEVSGRGGAR